MTEDQPGLLNENTEIVHKSEEGTDYPEAACGALGRVPPEDLRRVAVGDVLPDDRVDRCGRCFEEGNGY